MSEMKLYAIELENRKVFLHVCPTIKLPYLFPECKIMFDFVNKNPPIRVLNEIELEDVLKVDYYVKYFMRHYGIDNVRGGSYSDEVLPEYLLKTLRLEIETTFEDYMDNIDLYTNIEQRYNKKSNKEEEIVKINKLWKNYKYKKDLLESLSFNGYETIIDDIDWLKDEIDNKTDYYHCSITTVENLGSRKSLSINSYEGNKYKYIIKNIISLIDVYYDICDNTNQEAIFDSYLRNRLISIKNTRTEKTALIGKPQFVLDHIFLHPFSIPSWNAYLEIAKELLENITNIAYIVKNLIDEIEFDISKVSSNFEQEVQYSIKYLSFSSEC